jgi:peptidoglycan/xylan/chitin deacetylase (PgdA/CDA1 family)
VPPARIVFWAATLAGIGFAAYSVLTSPPALHVAVACSFAYGALITAGVLFLRLRMFADAVIRGPEGARGVALTFDDGPDPKTTNEVLEVLDRRGVKATFFVIGAKAAKHPDVVRDIIDRGHQVGVHSFAHDRLFSLRGSKRVKGDLERAVRTIEEITKKRPVLFRPPIGHTNPTIARVADELDLVVVGWTVAARDGIARAKPDDVVARVDRGLEDGAIVAMHDAAERGGRTPAGVTALAAVLDAIEAKNLSVVPLDDFIDVDS